MVARSTTPWQATGPPRRGTATATMVHMTHLKEILVRHRRIAAAAWLIATLVMAACQPDGNGGGGPGY